jgi:hypothetical protein
MPDLKKKQPRLPPRVPEKQGKQRSRELRSRLEQDKTAHGRTCTRDPRGGQAARLFACFRD